MFLACFFHVDEPLVAAAAEGEREVAFPFAVVAVDEDVGFTEERRNAFIVHVFKRFECISRIDPDVKAMRVHFAGERGERRGLAEGLAAGKGDASEQRIFEDFCQDGFRLDVYAALEIVRCGILAAKAVVRAALGEEGVAHARAVYDGIRGFACEFNGHHA